MPTDYAPALELATRTALAAGAILRDELHRDGGPRGPSGKCPADVDAERLVRARLGEAYPDWGLLAEELPREDREPRDAQRHRWLVDPNDGTRAMQRGARGAAVSIALLRGDELVLGVVYAHSAPDDDGDLFTWAEGCGPVRRNGEPVAPLPSRDRFAPDDRILVSDQADRRPRANVEVAAPARYLAMPSIAYRLALTAAGEAVVGSSLAHPNQLDFAGGHALLRAVGGELVDERGEVVRYHRGRASVRWCFGGVPALARDMARRDWDRVLGGGKREPTGLVTPLPDRHERDPGVLSRAQGCLLGQLAGDALGSLVEFQGPEPIRRRYPDGVRDMADGGIYNTLAGQPTDDSELALALARTLVEDGGFDAEHVAAAYVRWLESEPFDIGGTTRAALTGARRAMREGRSLVQGALEHARQESQANGALMRVSPLGVFGARMDPDALAELARADAAITHPNAACRDASAVFVVAVAYAIREGAGGEDVYRFAVDWAKRTGVHEVVTAALEDAGATGPPTSCGRWGGCARRWGTRFGRYGDLDRWRRGWWIPWGAGETRTRTGRSRGRCWGRCMGASRCRRGGDGPF